METVFPLKMWVETVSSLQNVSGVITPRILESIIEWRQSLHWKCEYGQVLQCNLKYMGKVFQCNASGVGVLQCVNVWWWYSYIKKKTWDDAHFIRFTSNVKHRIWRVGLTARTSKVVGAKIKQIIDQDLKLRLKTNWLLALLGEFKKKLN